MEADEEPADQDRRLRAAAEEVVRHFESVHEPFKTHEANEQRFRIIYPCAAHGVAQVKAALMLFDAGLAFPALTNARSAFEHAILAQWVLLTIGGDLAVKAEVDRQLRNKALAFNTFIGLPDNLLPGNEVKSDGPARKFYLMCERFSPKDNTDPKGKRHQQTLYAMYRNLSEATHVSVGSWSQYYDWDEQGISGLNPQGRREPGLDFMLAVCLGAILAVAALEELRLEQPYLAHLCQIAERYGVPMSLRDDDQHPELWPEVPSRVD